jgi:hypothetical protein
MNYITIASSGRSTKVFVARKRTGMKSYGVIATCTDETSAEMIAGALNQMDEQDAKRAEVQRFGRAA